MAKEPRTSEEYIELVSKQAQQQESEEVPTHQEIIGEYQNTTRNYQEKECFYTFVLVLLIIAFIVIKLFPNCLGFQATSTSEDLL